ncbi:hypothetical protein [Candidatus Manganitrophus noduliformans]|uniref:Uncharacterized protein n=1 Tax=Candidatus Manganitrophus noduliformans TaxID=2606439 RepID=A0A7X6DRC1_9BACT|nr:hypothetical protein [Candidatus Manganitrophus noduliformans]NKE71956.1 hypothetical protein [Candidatus Manganitrophus noduliformans]
MIVPLSALYEPADSARIYFVILDREISLPPDGAASSWNSTQIGIWASKGQVIAVRNSRFIPGIDTAAVEVVSFHQAYLVKPDLSDLILYQRKTKNGILISALEKRALSMVVKRAGEAIPLPESAPFDRTAERLMEGRMTLQQLTTGRSGNIIVDPREETTDKTGLIELVIVPRGVLFRTLNRQPVENRYIS